MWTAKTLLLTNAITISKTVSSETIQQLLMEGQLSLPTISLMLQSTIPLLITEQLMEMICLHILLECLSKITLLTL